MKKAELLEISDCLILEVSKFANLSPYALTVSYDLSGNMKASKKLSGS